MENVQANDAAAIGCSQPFPIGLLSAPCPLPKACLFAFIFGVLTRRAPPFAPPTTRLHTARVHSNKGLGKNKYRTFHRPPYSAQDGRKQPRHWDWAQANS